MNPRTGLRVPAMLTAALALTLTLTAPITAQDQSNANPAERQESIAVIPLAHTSANNNSIENLVQTLRNTANPRTRILPEATQNAIVIRGTAEEIEQARKIIAELDKPIPLYKLTYTITQTENGQPTATQHYTLLAAADQQANLKEGRRIPILTGTQGSGSDTTTQVQYLDTGLSISARLNGSNLRTRIEESAVADEKSSVNIQDPVIRQISLETIASITPGKPAKLGSLDIPNSTRHQEVEVLVERVQQ